MKTLTCLILAILACVFVAQTKLFKDYAWIAIIAGAFVYLFINLILSLSNKQ